jgi:hypothetical protein
MGFDRVLPVCFRRYGAWVVVRVGATVALLAQVRPHKGRHQAADDRSVMIVRLLGTTALRSEASGTAVTVSAESMRCGKVPRRSWSDLWEAPHDPGMAISQ